MPRYLVRRTFAESPHGSGDVQAVRLCQVGLGEGKLGVTCVHSCVRIGRSVSYCLYDAPSQEEIRELAEASGLPVDQITEVVLDPYFYP
jgi:hypothetical protein